MKRILQQNRITHAWIETKVSGTPEEDMLMQRCGRDGCLLSMWDVVKVLALSIGLLFPVVTAGQEFIRGDVNGDGKVSLADVHFLWRLFLLGGDLSGCINAGDVNDDGCFDLSDPGYLFNTLRTGNYIPPPFPEIGPDPTPNKCTKWPVPWPTDCESYGGIGPLVDGSAKLLLLDAVASGGTDNTVDITIGVSCSREIAGYRGTLALGGIIANYAGPMDGISGRPIPVDHTGSNFDKAWLSGSSIIRATANTFEFGFLRPVPKTTEWIQPGTNFPVMTFKVCLSEGVEAGTYPLELIAGELVDAETGQAIIPALEAGVLTVDSDISPGLGCMGVTTQQCGPPKANLGDLRVEMSLLDTVARPGQSLSIPLTIHSSADVREYSFCLAFDLDVIDTANMEVSFVFEKPDGTPYSRATWSAFQTCIPDVDGLTGEAWFSYHDECNNLPADTDVEACRLNLNVLPDAQPGSYELQFVKAGFFLAYDRFLPRDRPDGLSFINGHIIIPPEVTAFRRGDANADGRVDISDPIAVLGVLFVGDTNLFCPDASDANDDGRVDLSDPIYLLGSLYQGGSDPPLPGTAQCGNDPSEDLLGPCFYDPASC